MGKKWTGHEKPTADEGPATSDIERVRRSLERIAQGPSRTPAERAVDARVGVCTIDPDTQAALDAQDNAIDEQDATIDKLRKDVGRWIDDLETLRLTVQNEGGLAANLAQIIAENQALIAGQRAAIEALRVVFEEVAQGGRNLAGRIDKLEWWRDRRHTINQDIYRQMQSGCDKLTLDRMNGDDALDQRIQARAIELEHRIDALEKQAKEGNRE